MCKRGLWYDKNGKKGFKLYKKVRDHCHFTGKVKGATHCVCNLRYKEPNEIPVKIHSGSKHDYYLIIKELAEEFRGAGLECFGENTEKYISFLVSIR